MTRSRLLAKHGSLRFGLLPTAAAAMVIAGLMAGPSARAQSAPETAEKEKDKQTLDRVEVTSSKRRQTLSDVAGTVSAISGADIEKHGSADLEDLLKLTPGVQFNKGTADGSLISIRGVGTNSNGAAQGTTQAPTGIYIEDVPFTDPFAFVSTPDLSPFDLERVEVLRGPQGALYGSSSLGGAIRYIMAKPNKRVVEGSLLAGFSSTASGGTGWSTSAMANLPLADGKAGLRVVVNSREDPGFIDNLGTGRKDANTIRVNGGRVLFSYALTPDFDITAMYLRQRSKQADGPGISPFDYSTGTGYVKNYESLDVKTAFPMAYTSTFDLGTLQANLNLGDFRLTSLTGRQTKSRSAREDFTRDFFDPTLLNDKWTSDTDYHSKSTSQELRVTPLTPGRVNWLVGAFWMDADIQRDQQVYEEPRGDVADLRFRRNGKATEGAVFADAEIKITDRLIADIGARRYKTKLSYDRITGTTPADTASTPYSSSESGTTPKASLRYVIDESMSIYALASRGYRFGGISNLGSSAQGLPYKSDSLWNYEAGWRWSPTKSASIDLSVFRIDWKDVQLSELYVDPATNRSFLVTGNVGKAKSQGVEAAAAWRPFSKLSLKGTVAYTDAATSGGISIGGSPIASGTRLPGTAKLQGTLDATTYFEGPFDSNGRLSALLAYTGKRNAQIDSNMVLPSYTTVDLRASLSWSSVELGVFVNNAGNSRGLSSGVDYFTTYTEFYPIRPRTVGVTLRYDY